MLFFHFENLLKL